MKPTRELYDDKSFWNKKVTVSYILAVLVFFIHHSSYGQYTYDDGIVSSVCQILSRLWPSVAQVAVPLFMIIAGALFFRNYEQKLYPNKLKKRAKSLLIPYLTWNTLSMLFNMAATLFLAKYFVARQPFEFTAESILKSIFCYQANGQFWFVADLMMYIVLAPVLYVFIHNKLVGGGIYCFSQSHIRQDGFQTHFCLTPHPSYFSA